jgi:hypothetical protein
LDASTGQALLEPRGQMTTRMDTLLADIETGLVRLIPAAIKKHRISSPAYAVFLCYIDTTTDEHMPFAVVGLDSLRQYALERRGESASFDIWRPFQELVARKNELIHVKLTDSALAKKVERCYRLLDKAPGADTVDDNVRLLPFRRAMRNVARRLNGQSWSDVLPTTDDFVVVATDWSGFWVGDDVPRSLPDDRRELLESRKLLFHEVTEEDRQRTRQKLDVVRAKLEVYSEQQRIKFWIQEIRKLARDQAGLLRQQHWTEKIALAELATTFGQAAVLPLLDLAKELDALPHERNGQPSVSAEVLRAVMSTIEDIGFADTEVERRLRDLLATSCRASESRRTWTLTPFLCASVLARLIDGYDWPSRDMDDVLTDWQSQVRAPYRLSQS